MAIKEQDKVFYEEAENGDKVINLPVTRVNNVEGLGRSANTAYVVGDIVYVDNDKKVALKCTTAGTTSNTELDVSGKVVGESVKDGSVVWKVIARSNVLDEGGVVSIANGGTGGNTFIKTASISGKIITLNMSDGTTKTLTTQDNGVTPARYITTKYSSGKNWYEVYNDGWVRQGGFVTITANPTTVTLHKQMSDTNYKILFGQYLDTTASWDNNVRIYNPPTVSNFKVAGNANLHENGCYWEVEGYGA